MRLYDEVTMKKMMITTGIINFTVGGFSVQYLVEFWASYIKGVPVDIPFFPCYIAGIFIGSATILFSILTWLMSYAL